jgi:hypothetical protein
VTLRVAVPARDRRDEEQQDRDRDEPELDHQGDQIEPLRAAALVLAAEDERRTEDEQDVRDDAARERSPHHVRQRGVDGEEGDDQLRRVAEARVEEAADPGPRVLAGVLGRLADQPGERHQRGSRSDEQRRVADVEDVPEENHEGGQDERRPEELPAHAATLAPVVARSASRPVVSDGARARARAPEVGIASDA